MISLFFQYDELIESNEFDEILKDDTDFIEEQLEEGCIYK